MIVDIAVNKAEVIGRLRRLSGSGLPKEATDRAARIILWDYGHAGYTTFTVLPRRHLRVYELMRTLPVRTDCVFLAFVFVRKGCMSGVSRQWLGTSFLFVLSPHQEWYSGRAGAGAGGLVLGDTSGVKTSSAFARNKTSRRRHYEDQGVRVLVPMMYVSQRGAWVVVPGGFTSPLSTVHLETKRLLF